MHQKPHLCQRARAWASLRTDGELSELESALLDAHLRRCDSCVAFARGADEVAGALRAAQLERPAPLVIASRGVRHAGLRALQVAAAVVVVVSAGTVAAVSGPSGAASAAKPVAMVASMDSPDRLRELRRASLVEKVREIPRNRQGEAV
jgi:predicted anti-sigma-YlaC factor YlaD